ncbi:MAG: hypothetical protein ACXVAX_03210 [Pseudobdellovibrio sp.]
MKNLAVAATLIISFNVFAKGLEQKQHADLLNSLAGKSGIAKAQEDRTFYFADTYGTIVEISNSKDDITVNAYSGQDGSEAGIGFSLSSTDTDKLVISKSANGLSVQDTNYFKDTGSRQVFMTTSSEINVLSYGEKGFALNASLKQNSLWNYNASDADSSKWHWDKNAKPEVKEINGTVEYITSLTPQDTVRMGKQATRKAHETRDAGEGNCSMESAYIMKCEWSLETERTPDTLRGIFSIKDGKIRDLLTVEEEPGC